MTREEAHKRIDSGDLTFGHLKTLLRCEMGGPPHRSVVNPGMSHEQAVEILARSIEARDDDEIVAGPKSGRPISDRLIATNILRECREAVTHAWMNPRRSAR
jgi:hypothetical protein